MLGTREPIYNALFNLLAASASYKIKSRKLRLWTEVDAADKPALFMTEHEEDAVEPGRGLPSKTTLGVEVFIYIASNSPGISGASILNPLLDALDAAIAPDPITGTQTLGGLVSHCWVEGRTIKDPGDLDGQGLAVVPIRILVP